MTAVDAPGELELAPVAEPLAAPDLPVDPEVPLAKPERLASLDIFRGMTIAAMLVVNNALPGKYAPLEHAKWDGWTPTDLIFPFFLFIVGVAIPFSFARRSASEGRGGVLLHVWSRALSLVLLGALLHAFPSARVPVWPDGFTVLGLLRITTYVVVAAGIVALLFPWRSRKLSLILPPVVGLLLLALGLAIHFANRNAVAASLPETFEWGNGLFRPSHYRMPGVLQRIGICYGVGATIALFAGWRTVLLSILLLCSAYAALMLKAPFDGHVTGSLTMEDNFARSVDEAVFDRSVIGPDGKRQLIAKHTYANYPDPEGLVSTLPAVGSVLFGVLVGYSLRRTNRTHAEKCARLLTNGVLVTVLGVLLGWWLMPINKQIWTPSFAVFTAGMGMLTLGAVYYVTDLKGRRAWAWPFKVYGMNAIAAFVFSGVIVRLAVIARVTDPANGKPISLWTFCQRQVAEGVHRAGLWWGEALPYLPPLDTPGNVSLAFSLAYVVVILLVLSVMYAFRIFLKV